MNLDSFLSHFTEPLPFPILAGLIILLPRILENARIPMPLSALAMGMLWASHTHAPENRVPLGVVSTMAITMLFLFAGLEVDLGKIRRDWRSYSVLGIAHVLVVATLAFAASRIFALDLRAGAILAIGLVTPSAGFILDSLSKMKLLPVEKTAVGNGAIGLEVTSLLALLVVLRMDRPLEILALAAGIAAVFWLLPRLWRQLRKRFFPHVPKSEFVFIFLLAMVLSNTSKALGLYYIFGAFMTGVILGKINQDELTHETHDYVKAIELMTALFLPIYFFRAGSQIPVDSLSMRSLWVGAAMLVVVALRIVPLLLSRVLVLRESLDSCVKVTIALGPTLVFGLVIAEMLRTQTNAPAWLSGALVVHTLLVTMIPGFILQGRPLDVDPYHSKADISRISDGLPVRTPTPPAPASAAAPAPAARPDAATSAHQ